MNPVTWCICLVTLILGAASVFGAEFQQLDDPVKQEQYENLIEELRCPKCQNQNLAGSDSQIALSMKNRIKTQLQQGQSPEQIKSGLIDRYGAFISYKPPVNPETSLLWFFPPVLLGFALLVWLLRFKKPREKTRLSQAQREQLSLLTGGDEPIDSSHEEKS